MDGEEVSCCEPQEQRIESDQSNTENSNENISYESNTLDINKQSDEINPDKSTVTLESESTLTGDDKDSTQKSTHDINKSDNETVNQDCLDTGQGDNKCDIHEKDKLLETDKEITSLTSGDLNKQGSPKNGACNEPSGDASQTAIDVNMQTEQIVAQSGDLGQLHLNMTQPLAVENNETGGKSVASEKNASENIENDSHMDNFKDCDVKTKPPEKENKRDTQKEIASSVQSSENSTMSASHSDPAPSQSNGDSGLISYLESSTISNCDKINSEESSYVPVQQILIGSNEHETVDENDELLSQLESELQTEFSETENSVIQTENLVHKQTDIVKHSEQSNVQNESLVNGISSQVIQTLPEYLDLQNKYDTLQKLYAEKDVEIKRLIEEKNLISGSLQNALKDKDRINERLKAIEEKSTSGEQTYINIVKELENTIAQQRQEHEATKEKLKQHDEAAKKAINQIQTDLQSKLLHISKAYEECKREKEGMVVKYAMAEQKNIEMEDRMHKNIKKTQEWEREKDLAVNKFKTIRADRAKLEEAFHQRNAEIVSLRRELEKFKELRNEQELKTKWHQNKLKTELEAHKETKGKLEEANKKLKQAREEAESMKIDCQAMIKQYQETEENQKNSLAAKIGEKESALKEREQEVTDQREVHSLVKNQLETLKRNHKDMIEELRTAKDKITCLEAERLHQEDTLKKFKETLQHQKQDNKDLYDKLAELEGIEQQLSIEKEKVSGMKTRVEELEELNRDLRVDMEGCAKREGEHLEFTKRVSDKNAKLQSENSSLNNKLTTITEEHETLNNEYRVLKEFSEKLENELSEEKQRRVEEVGHLTVKLEEKTKAVEELSQQLGDQREENKILKRRHAASVKDLHRQLQQQQRKLEKGSLNGEISSMGSRTSSNNSLNTLVNNEQPQMGNPASTSPIQEEVPLPQEPEAPLVQFVEVDKQVLVEKIVRLQKAHARKNEKLEFMEEHLNQLVAELQKKSRVIQTYVMREESGTLSPESMDLNKRLQARQNVQAQLSKKGGIMASVYNSTARDDHMTMDLSLQINHKLQAVLEDTLLKNITLKESMDTLGKEISELSKQNRTLQLQIRALEEQSSAKS